MSIILISFISGVEWRVLLRITILLKGPILGALLLSLLGSISGGNFVAIL